MPRSIKLSHTQERCERRAMGPAREGEPSRASASRTPPPPQVFKPYADEEPVPRERPEPGSRRGRGKESHLGMCYANMHLAVLRVEGPDQKEEVPESRKLPEALDSMIKGNSKARLLGGLGEVTWGRRGASVSLSKGRVWVRFLKELRHSLPAKRWAF